MPEKREIIEILDVLACDITARPRGAATVDDISPHVRSVRREPTALVIEFAETARDAVRDFVAAEQRCCADLGWHLALEPAVELRIEATPGQIDVLEQMLAPSR